MGRENSKQRRGINPPPISCDIGGPLYGLDMREGMPNSEAEELPLYYICAGGKTFPLPLESARRFLHATPGAELLGNVFDVPFLLRPMTSDERLRIEENPAKPENTASRLLQNS